MISGFAPIIAGLDQFMYAEAAASPARNAQEVITLNAADTRSRNSSFDLLSRHAADNVLELGVKQQFLDGGNKYVLDISTYGVSVASEDQSRVIRFSKDGSVRSEGFKPAEFESVVAAAAQSANKNIPTHWKALSTAEQEALAKLDQGIGRHYFGGYLFEFNKGNGTRFIAKDGSVDRNPLADIRRNIPSAIHIDSSGQRAYLMNFPPDKLLNLLRSTLTSQDHRPDG